MSDVLWCAMAGVVAGVLMALPVWVWAWYRDRRRQTTFARLLREACLLRDKDA